MILFLWRLIYGKTCEHKWHTIQEFEKQDYWEKQHIYVMKCVHCGKLKNHKV